MLIHVRYDEIALKGGKRGWYERQLRRSLSVLSGLPLERVERAHGRLAIRIEEGEDPAPVLEAIGRTFGVASAQVGRELPRAATADDDLAALEPLVVALAREAEQAGKRTFKVETNRADKDFPIPSLQMSSRLGAVVLREVPGLRVDVHRPDVVITVEVREERVFAATDGVAGPGGYPVGVSGTALNLLSGGIDSPVAAWYALKRGLHVDHLYFHAFPYTGDRVLQKVLTLGRALGRFCPDPARVFVASTTKIQDAIAGQPREDLRIVLLRRAMYRLARGVLRQHGHKALVTGESLGQVASQTPENLLCVEVVVPDVLVLRPLLGFDKREIVAVARRIGTFETSILPYQDCCSLFAPRRPATHASVERCLEAEAGLPLAELEAEALAGLETWRTSSGGPVEREGAGAPHDAPAPPAPSARTTP